MSQQPPHEDLVIAVGMLLDCVLKELTARCASGIKIGIEQGSREQTEIVFASIETEERLQTVIVPSTVVPILQSCFDRILHVHENKHGKHGDA